MRKSVNKLLVITYCVLSLYACKNDDIDSGFVVYAAGYEVAPNHNNIVKYWKNGVGVNLNDSSTDGFASSIFVSNNHDVYIAGVETEKGKNRIAKYWKNGVAGNLNNEKYSSRAQCIYVDNSIVYVSGYEIIDTKQVGVIWKNGIPEYYTTMGTHGNVNCVFSSNNTVYSGGSESTNMNGNNLKYRIDGNDYYIGNGRLATDQISSIFVINGNVYMAGSMHLNNDEKYDYWINEKPYTLKNGGVSMCSNSIFVSNDDIYIAGHQQIENSNSIAKYWKNGNEVNLTTSKQNAEANSIFVIGNDVFVGGTINNEPCYWINGRLVKLNNGVKGAVFSIFVTRVKFT